MGAITRSVDIGHWQMSLIGVITLPRRQTGPFFRPATSRQAMPS
jgi:hypothetical protein